jgi:DNA-binding transcriptional regulator YdaS (Cro superfamily)
MLEIVQQAADIVGGTQKLADLLGCSRQALSQWDEVPRGRVLEIEEATGRKITRHQLRPDLYPEAPQEPSGGNAAEPNRPRGKAA